MPQQHKVVCVLKTVALAFTLLLATAHQHNVFDVSSSQTFDRLTDNSTSAVVLYYAAWCPHSQALAAAMDTAAAVFAAANVTFLRVAENGNRDIFQASGVTSVPVLHLLQPHNDDRSGTSQRQLVFEGNRTAVALTKWLHKHLYARSLLDVASVSQAHAFALLPLPVAIGWFDGGASQRIFEEACLSSEDVLCALFAPGPLATYVQFDSASSPNETTKAVEIGADATTVHEHRYRIVAESDSFFLLEHTTSIFPSAIIEEHSLLHTVDNDVLARILSSKEATHATPSDLEIIRAGVEETVFVHLGDMMSMKTTAHNALPTAREVSLSREKLTFFFQLPASG